MRGFDRKIFGCIFVHFAKIVKSPIGTAEPVQIAESRHLINFSKIQDMKARVDLINEKAPGLAVSIHQNSYHEEEIHGAQVFYYSHSAEGHTAAKLMQQALLGADSENTRQEKANDTYYLLRRTQVPTIIVECGFLSNQQEAELLAGKDYQKKIAKAIATGIDEYLRNAADGT